MFITNILKIYRYLDLLDVNGILLINIYRSAEISRNSRTLIIWPPKVFVSHWRVFKVYLN